MAVPPQRKLTAIIAADAVGYSAMMSRDEVGTLARLKTARRTIGEETERHRGRIVNTAGDAVIAEFSSVVNAVECAVSVQRILAERNATLPQAERLQFRIGINLGDVIVEGDDIFGDGVNIAARLEAIAEPGGILISNTVFDQVRTKLALGFDFLGPQSVKNIAEPVPAWRIVLGDEGDRPGLSGNRAPVAASFASLAPRKALDQPTTIWRKVRRATAIAAVLVVFLFAINLLTWSGRIWFHWPATVILVLLGLRVAWATGEKPDPTLAWARVRRSAIITGVFVIFFIAINIFTWSGRVWFQWPAIGFLAAFGIRLALAIGRR